ncbi:hypothetical protein [Pseudomonas sp. 37 R 15]|nr:hypothetical protein [Pseudomonas sp. 37 R 15]
MLTRRDRLSEKALLHRRQDDLTADRALIDSAQLIEARHHRQAADALVLEQVARAEADTGLAGTADHLDGNDRIAAQFEKVVIQADGLDA